MKYIIFCALIALILISGCTQSQNSGGETPKYTAVYIPRTVQCFDVTDVEEKDFSSGHLGSGILDMREVTGTVKNTCPRIMDAYLYVRWYDETGKGSMYGIPIESIRLKSGDVKHFRIQGIHQTAKYGYLEEGSGWTYKVFVSNNVFEG